MIAAVLDEAKVGISAALVDVDEEDKTELVTVEVPPLLNLYKSKRELPPQISVLFKEQGILQSVVAVIGTVDGVVTAEVDVELEDVELEDVELEVVEELLGVVDPPGF
ncbi:hypothetical protein MMC14_010459 [Varicellaria rhodocarpa]|nr:hypothetical protein [Varicellaria rhodocarpa]